MSSARPRVSSRSGRIPTANGGRLPPAGRLPPQRHGRTRGGEDGRRVGRARQPRPAVAVGNAQRVAVVALTRIRETEQPSAADIGGGALVGVGHHGAPLTGGRSARRQPGLVHVAVRRMGPQPAARAAQLVPVVLKSHVVPQLVGEDPASTMVTGDAENATDMCNAAKAAAFAVSDDQMNEGRPRRGRAGGAARPGGRPTAPGDGRDLQRERSRCTAPRTCRLSATRWPTPLAA